MSTKRKPRAKATSAKIDRSRPSQNGKVRIIAGRWRRRTLPVAEAPGLRPTGSRVRETLFNWLAQNIQDAECIDLFAGTGALGLEALSRGACHVQFIEANRNTLGTLKDNLATLGATSHEFELIQADALDCLHGGRLKAADLIFVDPPFELDLWQRSIDALETSGTLKGDALIYVESPRETKVNIPSNWNIHRTLNAGAINATLYNRLTDNNE